MRQCPVHRLDLIRHEEEGVFAFWEGEGCWDCPVCDYHQHESPSDTQRFLDEHAASCKPQPLYGRGPVRSILPSEIPPWAQTILIVLLGLALFAAMVRW